MKLYDKVEETAAFLNNFVTQPPQAAIILGTGLSGTVDLMNISHKVPYSEIPHFPVSTVKGHDGNLLIGSFADVLIVAMQGRFHYYEGYSPEEITFPVRVFRRLGCSVLIINSACGGLKENLHAGDIMVVTDHIGLFCPNPLRGLTDNRLGDRFPDMSKPYCHNLIDSAASAAEDLDIPVMKGVYAYVPGPSMETRAETAVLKLLGADTVGMSTVPEVITAVQVGFRTLVFAVITNVNVPDSMEPVSLEQVIAVADASQPRLLSLMKETLKRASL
jgi:purine-nucleoside phosphorylase